MVSKDLKDYREDDLLLIRKHCLGIIKKKNRMLKCPKCGHTEQTVGPSNKSRTDAARLLAKVHDALTRSRDDKGSQLPKELQDILDGSSNEEQSLFMKWEKSEQTWLEKWKGQSTTFTKKVDRTKRKKKAK